MKKHLPKAMLLAAFLAQTASAQETARDPSGAITGSGRGGEAAAVDGDRTGVSASGTNRDAEPRATDLDHGGRGDKTWIGLIGLLGLAGFAGLGRRRDRRAKHMVNV